MNMAFNLRRTAQWYDKEVLKYASGTDVIESVVLDATTFSVTTTGDRYVVPAGTILKISATNSARYTKYNGTGAIEGILARPVDLLAQSTAGNEPAPMFFHECVFATNKIVDFTTYASALVTTLTTCKFR